MVTDSAGRGGRRLERLEAVFDDERVVANAGLLLASTLSDRLGLERLVDQCVALGDSSAGAGPGSGRLVIDVDSFVCEVHGEHKQGAGFGYTHKLGYHPLVATRAGTLETLHIRQRRGSANTRRGAVRLRRRARSARAPCRRDGRDPAAWRLGLLVV
jgi:hypothetical protein